jgi:DNA-binding response OmpR family regulator
MTGQQRILLVDDDPEALEMLCEFFVDEGYDVETASDGRSALDKLQTFAADIVVTDYEMPGMSGAELIRLMQARRPGQAVLLVSAREDCPLPGLDQAAPGGLAWLQKPVDLDDLIAVVRRLIDANSHDLTGGHAMSSPGG